MNWLQYLLEGNLYLSILYLCYRLFLTTETHHTLNRIYLLVICILSLLLPLTQLGFLKPIEVVAMGNVAMPVVNDSLSLWDITLYAYLICASFFVVRLGIKIYQVQALINANPVIEHEGYKLVYLNNSNTAFSFFNFLFIGTNTVEANLVTRHELVHINQKHSADIIFLEIFKIVNWFNPMVYLLQNSLKSVHEFIADERSAIAETNALEYSTFLVNNAYGLSGSSITHSFFNYNLLKRRIIMLNQKRSGKLARLKYLMIVPLSLALMCESTLGFSKTYGWINIAPAEVSLTAQEPVKIKDVLLVVPERSSQQVPPPPPEPPKRNQAKRPVIRDVKLLPPPPPEPPKSKSAKKSKIVRESPPVAELKVAGRRKPKNDVVKFPPPIVKPYVEAPPVVAELKVAGPRKPKNDMVKFPPPVVRPDRSSKPRKTDVVKFPPPVVMPDRSSRPKKIDVIKFPPPVVKPDAAAPSQPTSAVKKLNEVVIMSTAN